MSDIGVPGIRKKGILSPFKSLLSMQFKIEYGQRGVAEKLGLGKKARATYVYLALIALAFIPMMALLYSMGESLARALVAAGQPGIQVILAMSAAQFIVVFIGISALMSTLYYSSDLETLQALPLTARQILVAKVLIVYVVQLLFTSVVMLPFLVPLGLELRSASYWLFALVLDVTAPAIPLGLALVATVLIMRATRGLKQKDLFRVVFGLAFFVLIMVFEYVNVSFTSGGIDAVMRAVMQRNGLIQIMSTYYPPLRWAAWALTGSSAMSQLSGVALFAVASVVVLGGSAALSQRWFLSGAGREVRTAGRTAAGGRAASNEAVGQAVDGLFLRQRQPSSAIAWRDHKVLTRTPNFFLVTLTNLALVPIMWVLGMIGSRGEIIPGLNSLLAGQATPIVLTLVAVQGFLAAMNQVASTAISREGGSFWLSKMIPIPGRVQIRGKIRYSMAVAALQLATLLGAGVVLFRLGPANLVILAVLGMLASWPVSVICILNDLYSPRLNWTDPHQAIKGNFATLGAMLFSLVYVAAAGFLVRLAYKAGTAPTLLYLLCAGIAAISGAALQRFLEDKADARYNSIEV